LYEGRVAAQRLYIRRETNERNAELRDYVGSLGSVLRPPGVLTNCHPALLAALLRSESEARATGSALVQPWHLLIAIFDQLTRYRPPCPVDVARLREAFRPMRTISLDESPGHLPLARSLRKILTDAVLTRRPLLRPEFVAQDLLNAGDDAAHRAALALRHPVDTEAAVRAWLDRCATELGAIQQRDDATLLPLLADIVEQILDRPEEADAIRRVAARLST
jgi:hypothetical protein